jgi:hypothetical protein
MHAPSSTLSSVSQAHCQSPLLARAAVTRRSSWRHSLCQLEAESMEIRGEVMRRDFHFPNALHSVCVCVCFYLNFFLQCITHSRRRPKHQPSLLRSAVPFFFSSFSTFDRKTKREQSSAVTTCAQAGSNNAAGSQLATRRFRESKGRGKGPPPLSRF